MGPKSRTAILIAVCMILFSVGWYILSFGALILCCSTSRAGGLFWTAERLFYGLLPICVAISIFGFTFSRWGRLFGRLRNSWMTGFAGMILCIALDLTLFFQLRGQTDDHLKQVWRSESSVFDWGSGEVRLPAGFVHQRGQGIDTIVGRFTSPDGKVQVEYDIGELAGEHGGMGSTETLSGGARVRTELRFRVAGDPAVSFFSKVSFPDSGCANFSLQSADESDSAIIEFIARSFRPKGRLAGWIVPFLPEVLRRDCRYNFRLPGTILDRL